MVQKELLAPCGLYCGVCGVFMAHRNNDTKLKERLSTVYGVSPEEIACEGCQSDVRFKYCRHCQIRACVESKSLDGCRQCSEWPCTLIELFPVAVGKKVMLRAIPAWRELGTEKWVESEEQRYRCPACDAALFRGARRCRNCKEPVDQD